MPLPNVMGASPLGASIVQPPVPTPGTPPQVDPSLWQKFLQKMETDPNFQTALLTTGLNLLGDPQQGESGLGTFARAATTGVQTLDQLRTRDREEKLKQGQLAIQQQSADANTSRAETSAEQADTSRLAVENRQSQFQEQLNESKRQFDARHAAGDFGQSAGSTSAVNARIDLNTEALITSGRYPDTEEGRASARLFAQGITDKANPQQILQLALREVDNRFNNQIFLPADQQQTREQIQAEVLTDTQAMLDQITAQNVPQPEQENLDGVQVPQGTLIFLEEGKYAISLPDGTTRGPLTRQQAEALAKSRK